MSNRSKNGVLSSDQFGQPTKKALRKKQAKAAEQQRQRKLEMSASQASHASSNAAKKKAREGERKMNQERGL